MIYVNVKFHEGSLIIQSWFQDKNIWTRDLGWTVLVRVSVCCNYYAYQYLKLRNKCVFHGSALPSKMHKDSVYFFYRDVHCEECALWMGTFYLFLHFPEGGEEKEILNV